jgi:chemotaxis protein CheX
MISVEFINPFVAATLQTLEVMASSRPTRGNPFVKTDRATQGDISGVIQFAGDATGCVAVTFPSSLAAAIYSRMVGEAIEEPGEEVRDAVGEIANMVAGGAKAVLAEKGLAVRIAVPNIVVGKNHTIAHRGDGPYLVVPFRLDDETFWLELSFTATRNPG